VPVAAVLQFPTEPDRAAADAEPQLQQLRVAVATNRNSQ